MGHLDEVMVDLNGRGKVFDAKRGTIVSYTSGTPPVPLADLLAWLRAASERINDLEDAISNMRDIVKGAQEYEKGGG